jgi:glycosyltransferase involved in cell wall biosynthesis
MLGMKQTNQLVSIAMATYNGEKYLTEQLDCLLQQTYAYIEIIVVDDGSKDNTVAILHQYQQNFNRIKVYINETNIGVTKTFEKAIENSMGTYIALCDQDDIWELDKIAIMVNEIDTEDAVYCNSLLVDSNNISIGKDFKQVMNLRSYYSGAPFLLANCIPGHTILMKKDFVLKCLPFPTHIYFDRWISFCAASNNGVRYIDKPLVRYRQHATNVVGIRKLRKDNKRETANELFNNKLKELQTFATAPIASVQTRDILTTMLRLFTKKWSLARSIFFFKNINTVLIIKNKPYYRKIFYCIKMIFKANY